MIIIFYLTYVAKDEIRQEIVDLEGEVGAVKEKEVGFQNLLVQTSNFFNQSSERPMEKMMEGYHGEI